MGDLSAMSLQYVYDSEQYHLVNDLINPLLSNSIEYSRGVGYFSSGWLRLAASGISDLISTGGKAKLIMSPILSQKDWQAIVLGQHAKENETLKNCLEKSLDEIAVSLEAETLNTFSWLIADDLIDVRFAIPKPNYQGGDYHDKVACFKDEHGNCVAIHGSYNDSIKGTLNGEAFSVFRSWEPGQLPFVEQHKSRLEKLWQNQNDQFYSYEIPKAIRQQIVQLRSTPERPYKVPSRKKLQSTIPRIPDGVHLRDYQNEAIKAWQDNHCRGIWEMATGTGKTFTALGAAVTELKRHEKLITVILVPYLHLLNQWEEDCKDFNFKPILCGSSNPKWKTELRSAVSDFRFAKRNLCVIAVHKTASNPAFLNAFNKVPCEQKMMIADEVHGLGASQLCDALHDDFSLRLGLSATPKRWYDEEGTQLLFNYFDKVCYDFPLERAIDERFLVPYNYFPQLVNLTDAEEYKVEELTQNISKLFSKEQSSGLESSERAYLEKILRDRALTIKRAENKLPSLRNLITNLKTGSETFQHSLFYSPESQCQDVLRLLKNEGIFARQFIGEDSPKDRKKALEQFAKGEITSLVAMKCLDEGVDVPSTKTAFFIASTTNPKEFIQRRGRVLRRAQDKEIAFIYDFFVVPKSNTPPTVSKYLLERELPRFAEFSDSAANQYAARNIIRPILDEKEMLHLMDMKPWDVYLQNLSSSDERKV